MSLPSEPPSDPADPADYEFSSTQDEVIGPLAAAMRWVAAPLSLVGVLYAIATVLYALQGMTRPEMIFAAAYVGLAAAFFLALGTWTGRAAVAFRQVAETEGFDVAHLMDALGNLRKAFALLALIVKVYVVLVLIAVAAMLVMAITSPSPR